MRNLNRQKYILFLLAIACCLTIGFAVLSSSLSLNGSTTVSSNTWDVKFQNIVLDSENTVTGTQTITDNTTINFSTELDKPGDKYAFTVDVVNAGSIDVMVDIVDTDFDSLSADQLKYLDYSVTYSNGVDISSNDLISNSSSETIKITIEYKKDIEITDLPSEVASVSLSPTITYKQADDNAKEVPVFLSDSAFGDFVTTYFPESIVFTNTGASSGTDLSEAQDGSIYGWMGTGSNCATMYVSRSSANKKVFAPVDSSGLFNYVLFYADEDKDFISNLDLSSLDTSHVTNMRYMFAGFEAYGIAVTTLDLSGFDTSNVTDMSGMFENTFELESLDLSSFDTSNVTNMGSMFEYCHATSIDLSSFDTRKVTNMYRMFYNADYVEELDLSSFYTNSLVNAKYIFHGCEKAQSIDVSHFDTSKLTSLQAMFNWCESLESIDLTSFDTSYVTDMSIMFQGCKSLVSVDISSFNTSKVTTFSSMFYDCTSITSLRIPVTNGNGINNTTSYMYGKSTGVYLSVSASGRTVTLV